MTTTRPSAIHPDTIAASTFGRAEMELASDPDGTRYATALHRLFDLDPEAIEALSAAQASDADPTVAQLLGGAE